jgi:streptogramin lyase
MGRGSRTAALLAGCAAMAVVAVGGTARAGAVYTPVGTFTVFPVPQNDASNPLYMGHPASDGNVWFTEFHNKRFLRVTPAGVTTSFALAGAASLEPYDFVEGPDHALWFTSPAGHRIGRFDLTTHAVTWKTLPSTVTPSYITLGPDRNLWFTSSGAAAVVRMTTAGVVTVFTSGLATSSNLGSIAVGPDGALWFGEQRTVGTPIGRITTAGVVTHVGTFATSTSSAWPVAGPDGALWVAEYGAAKIGRLTAAGNVDEIDLGSGAPPTITVGPGGTLWSVDMTGRRILRITTAGVVTEFSLPNDPVQSTPTPYPYPMTIAAGADGNMWFDIAFGHVARITTGVPSAPLAPVGHAVSTGSIDVAFSSPSNPGVNAPTRFTVVASPGGRSCSAAVSHCTIAGLTPTVAYRFTVRATNGAGTGPASAASAAVFPTRLPTAPRTGVVTFPAAGQVKVAWTAPVTAGAAAITRYEVRWSSNGGTTWSGWSSTALVRSVVKSALSKGHAYKVQIRAVNAIGASPVLATVFVQGK